MDAKDRLAALNGFETSESFVACFVCTNEEAHRFATSAIGRTNKGPLIVSGRSYPAGRLLCLAASYVPSLSGHTRLPVSFTESNPTGSCTNMPEQFDAIPGVEIPNVYMYVVY